MPATRNDIEPLPRGRHRVWHGDGVLVEGASDPEAAACRVLAARSITGPAEMFTLGGTVPRMRITSIEAMGGLTFVDDESGLRCRKRRPFFARVAQDGDEGLEGTQGPVEASRLCTQAIDEHSREIVAPVVGEVAR